MMTSRERVHAALRFQRVDRVPSDLNLTMPAYEKLKTMLGVCPDDRPKPSTAMEVVPPPELLEKLGVDCISVKLGGRAQMDGPLPEKVQDAWGVGYRLVRQSSGQYYEPVIHPLSGATLRDLDAYPWPEADPGAKAEQLRRLAEEYFTHTGLALVGRFGGPVLEIAAYLLGMEEWFVRLMNDRAFVTALLDRIERVCTTHDLAGIEAAGEWLSMMKVSGEDFGTQNALLYPPDIVHEVLLPVLGRRWDAVHRKLAAVNPEVRVMLHSCGAIRPLIPRLIEAGIEVLDPVQPLATGMSPVELYAEFGGHLVFHGGIDVQHLLPYGTTDQLRRTTHRVLKEFRALQGGCIAAPSHTVQADTPPENIVAMIGAINSFGRSGASSL